MLQNKQPKNHIEHFPTNKIENNSMSNTPVVYINNTDINTLSVKSPNDLPLIINKRMINKMIDFIWTDNVYPELISNGYKMSKHKYFGDSFYYKTHSKIFQILSLLSNEKLEDYLVLDAEMKFDYGLMKQIILLASFDDNYEILDYFIARKINFNKIYFDGMSLLEYSVRLFQSCDNFEVIELFITFGNDPNKPFKDGSFLYQNFITSAMRLTISKFTSIDKNAYNLYVDEKMDMFYSLYFNYGISLIERKVILRYLPKLIQFNTSPIFINRNYLISQQLYIDRIESYIQQIYNM